MPKGRNRAIHSIFWRLTENGYRKWLYPVGLNTAVHGVPSGDRRIYGCNVDWRMEWSVSAGLHVYIIRY